MPSKVPIAPTPEDSNTPLSGYLVPIAPATNLARKFLGTSHASSRARAHDQCQIDLTLLDPQHPRPRAIPPCGGFPMSKLNSSSDSAALSNPASMTDYAPAREQSKIDLTLLPLSKLTLR